MIEPVHLDIDFPLFDHDLSFHMPTKLHSHPIVLVNKLSLPTSSGHSRAIMMEPYVHNDRSIGGIFVRSDHARRIGLSVVGEADTIYGSLTQYSPVDIVLFSRHASVSSVFELPHQFAGTKYADGVVGIETFWALGVNLVLDRGMIFIEDPENSGYASYTRSTDILDDHSLPTSPTAQHVDSAAAPKSTPISIIHHRRLSESIPIPIDKTLSFGYAYPPAALSRSVTSPAVSIASSLSDHVANPSAAMSPPELTTTGTSWNNRVSSAASSYRDRYVVWD
ncbi:hypothetical protein BJ742DRAFT_107078 [Cladochytrium replicatum]|nr:hypothetical protein BJ742DRAFT_107078 [Cladochytrium replicatum]